MVVSILGACAFRIIWVMTIFAASPTMTTLMLSYPVSWALTFFVLVFFFGRIWPTVRSQFTPEEQALF